MHIREWYLLNGFVGAVMVMVTMIVMVMEDGVYYQASVVGADAWSWKNLDREGIRLVRARF